MVSATALSADEVRNLNYHKQVCFIAASKSHLSKVKQKNNYIQKSTKEFRPEDLFVLSIKVKDGTDHHWIASRQVSVLL